MKKGISLSAFHATEGAIVFRSGNLDEDLQTVADLGYDGIDLFVESHDSPIIPKLKSLLMKYGLETPVLLPGMLAKEGLTMSDPDESVRDELVARMGGFIELAADLGGDVPLGWVRGGCRKDETYEAALERIKSCTERLLQKATPLGVRLLVEPINRYEINTFNTVEESFEFIQASGLELYLMLDTFHMNIEDVSIEESIRSVSELIVHVQFLDSNRLAPGMGHLDMFGIYQVLQSVGYDGYLSLEGLPKPDALTIAEKGKEFFEKHNI